MIKRRRKITFDLVVIAALRHSTRAEFAKHDSSEYLFAWRSDLLDRVCAHMTISDRFSYVKWDKESCAAEAAKHKTRSVFRRGCQGAYGFALANNLLDAVCAHMDRKHNVWAGRDVAAEALKYSRRCDFKKFSYSAYEHAHKAGLLDSVCIHMISLRRNWSKDSVLAVASEYNSRGGFHGAHPGAYKHAIAGGYLEEACAHMDDAEYGFDFKKPAVLYVIKLSLLQDRVLYKIGITNRSAKLRLGGMGVPAGVEASVLQEIRFTTGLEARAKEREIHAALSSVRYHGAPVLKNGNKELFGRDAINHLSDLNI